MAEEKKAFRLLDFWTSSFPIRAENIASQACAPNNEHCEGSTVRLFSRPVLIVSLPLPLHEFSASLNKDENGRKWRRRFHRQLTFPERLSQPFILYRA